MAAAAFAVAHGCARPQLEELSHARFRFVFGEDPEGRISKLILGYFNGDPAPACEFYKALQNIRHAINFAKQGGAR